VLNDDDSLRLTGVPCPRGSLRERIRKWLAYNSALVGILLRPRYSALQGLGNQFLLGEDTNASRTYAVRLTVALIDRMNRVVSDMAAKFVVVALCEHLDVGCESVVHDLQDRGSPVLPIHRLVGYDREKMVFAGENHWNAAGHEFVTSAILDFLKQHHLP
jgi:hypothetical protein